MSVTVAPATQSVLLGATQTFTATVTNATSTAVTWSVNGITNGNSTVGTIDANGLYRGPAILPSPAAVTIRATSVASPTSSGTATVTVTSDVVVSFTSPAQNASVEVGAAQQISKSIASTGNGADQNVTWAVAGNGCSGAACGTINSVSGLFTAPGILPSTPNRDVTVTATSVADPSKSATLTLHITANFGFTITGPASGSVDNAVSFQFTFNFTPVANSAPSQAVTWRVDPPAGGGCAGTACGTIDLLTGLYTAPNVAPSPASVAITGIPTADPSKARTVTVTINSIVIVAVSPTAANVEIEGQQQFTANVGGLGLNSQNVTWSISGPNCANPGNPCGSISNPGPVVGSVPVIYTAPITIPSSSITVTATSVADITKSASVTLTFFSTISASLQPSGSTRAVNHSQTLTGALSRASTGTAPVNNAVTWSVNGVAGGDATNGLICAVGVACNSGNKVSVSGAGSPTGDVDYVAPAAVPAGSVTIEMRSQADTSRFTTASVTVAANVTVIVSPSTSTVPASGTQPFTATVVGTANQNVTWSVSGAGCIGAACGTITSPGGLYTAPATAPGSAVTVTATSVDDPLRSGSGAVSIAAGAFITKISPASITSLAAGSTDFTIKVQGLNFTAGASGSGGSTIVFNAQNVATTCDSSTSFCTATVLATSVTSAGDYGVQVVNPPGSQFPGPSNQVALRVLAAATEQKDFASASVVTLSSATPNASNQNITVVEPTTVGSGAAQVNIGAIGFFTPGVCSGGGTPITITRLSSGSKNVEICLFASSGGVLSSSFSYTISGPAPNNDIMISGITAIGNAVHFTLTVPSTALTGPRTLFVETQNHEKSALVGAIEVK